MTERGRWKPRKVRTNVALATENVRLRRLVREQQDSYRRLQAEYAALRKAVFLPWRGFIS